MGEQATRRGFLKAAGAGIGGLVIGGVAGYFLGGGGGVVRETITNTVTETMTRTVGAGEVITETKTITETVRETITKTVAGAPQLEKEIWVWNWYEDWGQYAKRMFELTYKGTNVIWTSYESNEEWYTALQTKKADIVVGEVTWVRRTAAAGLIEPINIKEFENYQFIFDNLKDLEVTKFEGKQYGIPIAVGFYPLLYSANVKPEPDSWEVLWDDKYRGRITMPDYAEYAIQMTALYIGDNPHNPRKWDEIRELLIQQKPLVKKYWTAWEEAMMLFVNGDVDVGLLTAGRAIRAQRQHGWKGSWTVPKEGAMAWVDNMMIAKDAPHPNGAKAFVEWTHMPYIATKFPEIEGYMVANKAAIELLSPEIKKYYEWPEEYFARAVWQEPLAADVRKKMDELWNEVKLA